MNRDEARQEIRARWSEILPRLAEKAKAPVNGKPSYVCPLCGHGKGGDGLAWNKLSKDGNGLKCFGCGFSGDVIDLFMKVNHVTDFRAAVSQLSDMLGLDVSPSQGKGYDKPQRPAAARPGQAGPGPSAKTQNKPPLGPPADYTAYYRECNKRLASSQEAIDYLQQKRGISLEVALAAGLGYDSEWKSPTALKKGANPPATKRLIIPTCPTSYFARAIDVTQFKSEVDKRKYEKMNEGSPEFFNVQALDNPETETVFVAEGAISALSIVEVGRCISQYTTAIGLNSINRAGEFLKRLKDKPTKANIILCLDNDEKGRGATKDLAKGLAAANIPFTVCTYGQDGQDPNDAVRDDDEIFKQALRRAVKEAKDAREAAKKPDNTLRYVETLLDKEISNFRRDIKTGFELLDKKADGLYSGLYVVAALASLGKTTFCHQIADQLAAAGNDVLFFSLEQSRLELVTKSLARITAQQHMFDMEEKAVTSLVIRRGNNTPVVGSARAEYKKMVGDRLSIIEGNFDCNVSFIRDYVVKYIERNGITPIVFIDYLQIIQGEDTERHQPTKEVVDTAITAIKRLSRELNLTIFVISSINRQNYLTPIDFESLKESGSIEFTSDVIWGLQLKVMNDSMFDEEKNIKKKRDKIKQAKAETPRQIELVCLKNRYGVANFSCYFDYFPKFDLYQEISGGIGGGKDWVDCANETAKKL